MNRNSNRQWVRMWLVLCILGVVACSKTTTTGPTDASIADSLKAAFYSAPELKNDRVDISVNNGEVTLSGEVSSDAARLQAYKLANDTPGVKKITDLLQVKSVVAAQEPPPPLEQPETPPPPAPAPKKTAAPKPKPASAPAEPSPSASSPVPVKPVERPAPAPPPPPPPRVVTVPAGTNLRIQMIDSVDSAKNKAGDTFLASLDAPLTVGDEVVVPKGADVQVKLINSKTSGKFKGQSELELELDRLQFEGNTYNLTSSTYQQVGGSRGKDTVKKTAIGAAIGTAIGALAGGGKERRSERVLARAVAPPLRFS